MADMPLAQNSRVNVSIWLARLGWLAVFVLVAGMFATNLPHVSLDTGSEWQVKDAWAAALSTFFSNYSAFVDYIIVLRLAAAAVFVATAVFLAWRKNDDWFVLFVSAVLLLLAFMFGMQFNIELIRYPAVLEQTIPAIRLIAPALMMVGLLSLFYLFPNGRFVPRWSALVLIPAILVILLLMVGLWGNRPDGWSDDLLPDDDNWWALFIGTLFGTALLGLLGQVLRFRNTGSPEQRQQTKWVLFGLGALLGGPFFLAVGSKLLGLGHSMEQFVSLQVEPVAATILPLSVGVSILRYRLWDVDLVLNRTLVYGALTAVVLVAYGLAVGLAGVLLPSATAWFVPFLALALVLVGVGPLRAHFQRWADRLLPVRLPLDEVRQNRPVNVVSGPLRLLQAVWLLLAAFLVWSTILRFADFNRQVRLVQDEWLVQTSLAALPQVAGADFARLIAVSGIWTLMVSWATAGFVFWRKRDQGMALYTAYLLLLLPFGIGSGNQMVPWREFFSFTGMGLLFFFIFIFPDGRFVPRSWRRRIALLILFFLFPLPAFGLVQLSILGISPDEQAYLSFMMTMTAVAVTGVASQLFRYRRLSDAVQRRQARWVLFGLAMYAALFVWVVVWISTLPGSAGVPEPTMALITLVSTIIVTSLLPLTIAAAIVFDRLWQMDVVLNRTLVFGGLTALVVVLYVVVVGILGTLFQSGTSLILSVLATGLIAVLLNPLRQRLQQSVNRFMYGQRDDPLTVLADLGRQLENAAVPHETLPSLVKSIGQTLKLPYVAIAVQEGIDPQIVAEYRERDVVAEHVIWPMNYQGEKVAELWLKPRAAGDRFTPVEERLLQNVARQAGAAVYAERLMDQLQRSRERLVTTREEERRRLRHDLHDGLGPQLATLTVKLSAAENLLSSDPQTAGRLLAEAKAESQLAIKEIRRVVDGLRPAVLDQLGLASALQEFANQHSNGQTQIEVQADGDVSMLPAAVEVAAYRIATEAATNALRHSNAGRCLIRLAVGDGLSLTVEDDGDGLPAGYRPGVGLASMQERVAELGGRLAIQSLPGQGATISIRLPLTVSA
jgi:signal transduction histidine kinase